jgi:tRNA pseudouridine55 synthase
LPFSRRAARAQAGSIPAMAYANVDGILLLDKPAGMTSNAALQAAKRLLGARKAGHGGTLDPLATGLLTISFGEATKFSGLLLEAGKIYAAEVRLGVTTSTGDAEGALLEERPVAVDEAGLRAVLAGFVGGYEQLPPAYSALKYRGRPLYSYARAGEDAPRVPRRVAIPEITLDGREGDRIRLTVTCGKGTYIRSLAEDIGARLGCGAHLASLRRLASGAFRLADAVTLAVLEAETQDVRRTRLLAPEAPLSPLPSVAIAPGIAARLRQGQRAEAMPGMPVGLVRVYMDSIPARFMGLGEVTVQGYLLPRRLIAEVCSRGLPAPPLTTRGPRSP